MIAQFPKKTYGSLGWRPEPGNLGQKGKNMPPL